MAGQGVALLVILQIVFHFKKRYNIRQMYAVLP